MRACVSFIPPTAICSSLLWDHGNCASSVAFHALPPALREEACSNDLLLSSLAIIALTINSRLVFLCGGLGVGVWGGGVPSLELLVMCLAAVPILPLLPFHCCYHVCFMDASLNAFLPRRLTDTECRGAPGRCFKSIRALRNIFHVCDMGGNISEGNFRSARLEKEAFHTHATPSTTHGNVQCTDILWCLQKQAVTSCMTLAKHWSFTPSRVWPGFHLWARYRAPWSASHAQSTIIFSRL